jgi:DNA repair protein RadA/Sms
VAKSKTLYVCSECGGQSPKWSGQCPSCHAWNTLVESVAEGPSTHRFQSLAKSTPVRRLADIDASDVPRFSTGVSEFDRVLGGGLVPGGVVLIGGDPGIGKSTLLLQSLAEIAADKRALYISGEESGAQIALRAQRLSLLEPGSKASELQLLAEIQLEKIQATIAEERPDVAVIDSIQTVYSDALTSAPGSVAQVRECAAQLTRIAKQSGTTIIMVGHVTKEGALAGPRVLEHIVDTVLYFEGDTHSSYRLVRAIKNRFGAVNELGVFAMTERGLRGVANPSALFLSQHEQSVPGSCVLVTQEGTRPLLVEVQALVDSANAPNPRRLAVGLEQNRLAMLLAVLHRLFRSGCVSECRGRRENLRARRRSGSAARDPFVDAQQAAAEGACRVRRGRARRRNPAVAARSGAAEGSGQARLFGRGDSEGQCAETADRRLTGHCGRTDRTGDRSGSHTRLDGLATSARGVCPRCVRCAPCTP